MKRFLGPWRGRLGTAFVGLLSAVWWYFGDRLKAALQIRLPWLDRLVSDTVIDALFNWGPRLLVAGVVLAIVFGVGVWRGKAIAARSKDLGADSPTPVPSPLLTPPEKTGSANSPLIRLKQLEILDDHLSKQEQMLQKLASDINGQYLLMAPPFQNPTTLATWSGVKRMRNAWASRLREVEKQYTDAGFKPITLGGHPALTANPYYAAGQTIKLARDDIDYEFREFSEEKARALVGVSEMLSEVRNSLIHMKRIVLALSTVT